jgi:hypothetical protein
MGDYKDKSKVVIPPLPEDSPYRDMKLRVTYALYRILAPHLRAEGVDPHSRLEVIVPVEQDWEVEED